MDWRQALAAEEDRNGRVIRSNTMLTDRLTRAVAAEFSLVTAIGLAVVIIGRVFSLD